MMVENDLVVEIEVFIVVFDVCEGCVVVVFNEVGMGIVFDNVLVCWFCIV